MPDKNKTWRVEFRTNRQWHKSAMQESFESGVRSRISLYKNLLHLKKSAARDFHYRLYYYNKLIYDTDNKVI